MNQSGTIRSIVCSFGLRFFQRGSSQLSKFFFKLSIIQQSQKSVNSTSRVIIVFYSFYPFVGFLPSFRRGMHVFFISLGFTCSTSWLLFSLLGRFSVSQCFGGVTLDPEPGRKSGIFCSDAPLQLALLTDFHTHPYRFVLLLACDKVFVLRQVLPPASYQSFYKLMDTEPRQSSEGFHTSLKEADSSPLRGAGGGRRRNL